MFSRKKRSYSQPPEQRQQPPRPSSAASVAANAAFLNRRGSNASLSSAAAAAALRSHTASPTPVADVQTKRMVRRNSNSSISSQNRQPFSSGSQNTGAAVGRRSSVSSMTERSFRSPSPGPRNRPPVPALPTNVPAVPTLPNQGSKRLSGPNPQSAGPIRPSIKTNTSSISESSQPSPTTNFSRPMSPPPPQTSARGHSLGRSQSSLGFTQDKDARPQQPLRQASNNAASPARTASVAVRPTSSSGKAQATPDEIKAFQARAASLLARPRSEAYAPAPSPAAPQKVERASSILKSNQGPPPAPSAQTRQNASAITSKAKQHQRTESQPINGGRATPSGLSTVSRSMSVSPARSAHFSEKPVTEGTKHLPPDRAISPAKSAMKSSRPTSPAFSSSKAASDTSDARSLLSDDGIVAGGKRKKSVRVSFEESPLTVGESATPQSPINNILSPQNRKSTAFASEPDNGPAMGSKPVLPSFASVRSRKAGEDDSPSSSPLNRKAKGVSTSDHASDSSVDTSETEERAITITTTSTAPSIAIQPATPGLDDKPFESPQSPDAPARASLEEALSAEGVNDVLQSSPKEVVAPIVSASPSSSVDAAPTDGLRGVHEALRAQHREDDLPGSSDYDEESEEDWSDAAEDPSEIEQRGFASLDAILESPGSEPNTPPATSAGVPKNLDTAAETPTLAPELTPRTPPSAVTSPQPPKTTEEEDWEQVRAYWSGLSEQSKQQLEAAATPLPDLTGGDKKASLKKKKKPVAEAGDSNAGAPLPPWPISNGDKTPISTSPQQSRASQDTQTTPLKPALKNSLRGSPAGKAYDNPPKASPKQRPMSANAVSATAIATAYNTGRPTSSIVKPTLQRSGSNDSNSSQSSFRKERKARRDASDSRSEGNGRISMRHSMRSNGPAQPRPQPKTKPAPRPMSPELGAPRVSMRHSMRRNSMESLGGQSVMSTTSERSISRIFGMGKKKQQPQLATRSQSMNRGMGSKFKSRFANDSDSDDDGRSFGFRSRFADSDDSDADTPQVAAQSLRNGNSKSNKSQARTKLDEDHQQIASSGAHTSADRNPKGMQVPLTEANMQRANEAEVGLALTSGTLRKPDNKAESRRSFLAFGKKNKKAASVAGDVPQSPKSPTGPSQAAGSPLANGKGKGKDTDEPPMTPPDTRRPESSTPTKARSASRARASSFLRRLSMSGPNHSTTTVSGATNSKFEYPPVPPLPDHFHQDSPLKDRPNTSDGVASSSSRQRPALGGKRDSAMTAPSVQIEDESAIYSMRTGKKKKFQGLRRKLGLYD